MATRRLAAGGSRLLDVQGGLGHTCSTGARNCARMGGHASAAQKAHAPTNGLLLEEKVGHDEVVGVAKVKPLLPSRMMVTTRLEAEG